MTATNALSSAILKRRYQSGVSQAQFTKFPVINEIDKSTDWTGDDWAISIETESPQGLGPDVPAAQSGAHHRAPFIRWRRERERAGPCASRPR